MAKTVFGMPSVGKKTGDDDNSSSDQTLKPNIGVSAETKSAPIAPAKPLATPMAKPVQSSKSEVKSAPIAGRTVFGMPAVKLPTTPAVSQIPEKKTPPQPAYSPTQSLTATGPRGAAVAGTGQKDIKDKSAFKATMLGMAAIRPDSQPPAADETTPLTADDNEKQVLTAAPMSKEIRSSIATPPQDIPVTEEPESSKSDASLTNNAIDSQPKKKKKKKKKVEAQIELPPPPKSNKKIKVMILIAIILSAIVAVFLIINSSGNLSPTIPANVPSGISAPGVGAVPTVPPPPVPGIPQAPTMPVAPQPLQPAQPAQ